MSKNTVVGKIFEAVESPVAQVGRAVLNPVAGAVELVGRKAFDMYDSGRKAKNAQESLENERRSELAAQASARARAKQHAATAGQRAGTATRRSGFLTNLGFGGAGGSGKGNRFGN